VLPRRSDILQKLPKQCQLLKSNSVKKLEKLDVASGLCCSDVRTSSTLKLLDTAGRQACDDGTAAMGVTGGG
jgi:hypothetical protein